MDALQEHTHKVSGSIVSRGSGAGNAGLVQGYNWTADTKYRADGIIEGRHGAESRPINYTIKLWKRTA